MLTTYLLTAVLVAVCVAGTILIRSLAPKPKLAGSLILSSLNALMVAAALLIGYRPLWTAALWLASWPLVLFTAGYIVADVLRPSTRKQAFIAAAILVPTLAEVWRSGLLLVSYF